ncbi:MAG: UDP-N-acetylglucosamine 2-epimerase (non-hydrolyzing) [Patescibacteria group bacterium]|nr:UDP-N-acetylglucosamine 2-epimerase (non-hydrolyzing) [Patescibacteria group bacterium]
MKVMTIVGTRPEMIKMWPVLKKLDELNFEHIFVHTGQNNKAELKDFIFRDLELREPDYDLGIDVSSYGKEVTDVIAKSDELFQKVKPDALIILGDTHSGLAVLPASHHGIKIFHMEAGLRAWDKRMPEQRNRILIDHISDILLPFGQYHRENLIREDIHPSQIFVTGNPTFETMRAFQTQINESQILKKLKLMPKEYMTITAHRKENVDDPATLQSILDGLGLIYKKFKKEIIYPMHPRTKNKITGLKVPKGIRIINPLGFYDFNNLNMNALCLLGDSGTTPEEGLFYKVPCVSIRKTSERYETVEAGAHIVAGVEKGAICEAVEIALHLPWGGRYDLDEDFSPSNVVINVLRSQMHHYFES